MKEFTAANAEIILTELQRRLILVERLQKLILSKRADELHDLQPLFERGLWIFGPEFEAVDFRSNRGLAEIVKSLLGGTEVELPNRRPDFVALPDSSIGIYSSDSYDDRGEIAGLRKVLIVELKRTGFNLTQKEMDQARDYAKELRKGRAVSRDTEIIGYVLGSTIEDGVEMARIGDRSETRVIPILYDTVLARAHARTFNLHRRLSEAGSAIAPDQDVEEVVSQAVQVQMFEAKDVDTDGA